MERLIIGIAAGTLTTIAFVPQAIKIYRTKNAQNLSILTFSIFSIGVLLWLVYGILIKEAPIIIANAITLILIILIVVMKIRYK